MSVDASCKGKVIIISGPSGAGKSTVVRRLLDRCPLPLRLSVSATTRAARPSEQNGVQYHFLSHDEFARLRAENKFLECKEVFGRGDWYGTLRSEVTSGLAEGKCVVLEIDVEGTLAVLEEFPEAVTIFLHPGSMDELERRLRGRATDSEASILRRLEVARREMSMKTRYQFEVVNGDMDHAVQDIINLLTRLGAEKEC